MLANRIVRVKDFLKQNASSVGKVPGGDGISAKSAEMWVIGSLPDCPHINRKDNPLPVFNLGTGDHAFTRVKVHTGV
jgi:hypothetical protein